MPLLSQAIGRICRESCGRASLRYAVSFQLISSNLMACAIRLMPAPIFLKLKDAVGCYRILIVGETMVRGELESTMGQK